MDKYLLEKFIKYFIFGASIAFAVQVILNNKLENVSLVLIAIFSVAVYIILDVFIPTNQN